MSGYVWRNGRWRDPATGEPMDMPHRDGVCMPMVVSDVPEHIGPDGKTVVSSRAQQREIAKRDGFIPWEPINHPKGYLDERMARAAGTTVKDNVKADFEAAKSKALKAAGLA